MFVKPRATCQRSFVVTRENISMEIKALLFDKDGTIISFEETFNPATRRVLEEICGTDQPLFLAACEVVGFDPVANEILPDSPVIAATSEDIAEALGAVVDIGDKVSYGKKLDDMFGAACLQTVVPLPGAQNALGKMKSSGFVLGVATNDAEENAVGQMKMLGFDRFFTRFFGADSGFGAKPGSGMMNAFAEFTGFDPKQICMVGDSTHDLQAGRAAGFVNIGVETGPAKRAELVPHADHVLASIADLPELLESLR